ncbi:MAG: hypothetical protein ACLGIN_18610 [Candidatus Sericytochromatia bacterium]
MGTTMKTFTDTASKFVNTSLDNMRDFIDRTAEEMKKADVIGANRRIADQLIDSTKDTVNRVADSARQADTMSAVCELATGTIESARETVRVASEETQRINLIETGSRVTQESLELVRRQVDLTFDTSREMGDVVNRLMPVGMSAVNEVRPAGVVTRVEIESDSGTIKTEPVNAR